MTETPTTELRIEEHISELRLKENTWWKTAGKYFNNLWKKFRKTVNQ